MTPPLKRWLVASGSAACAFLVGIQFLPDHRTPMVEYVETGAPNIPFVKREPPANGEESWLVRLPLGEDRIGLFFPGEERGMVFDRTRLKTIEPHQDVWIRFEEHPRGRWRRRINSLGMRDKEIAEVKPEFRVIVVGDSHVEGVCDNHESYPNQLEQLLHRRHPDREVEVLNAARGGWSQYSYLRALETYAALEPDVFVVTIYGGNDFAGQLSLHHMLRGEDVPQRDPRLDKKLNGLKGGLPSQFYRQVAYFAAHPEDEELALEMSGMVTELLGRICREQGIELLFVYLPPIPDVQPEYVADELEHAREVLELPPRTVEVSQRLADTWTDELRAAGIPLVDLRKAFTEHDEPLFWDEDLHINLRGHRVTAEEVLPEVERLLGLDRS
ncbi:MAG: SGNH/GDSL hydrolase family protein [Planctomycetota bacterium]|nr:SGNH/GDSL hydrolase family protein [Planctomycetota bacterium]